MSYMIFLFIYSMIYLRGIMNRRFYYRAVSVVFVLALLMTAFAGCGKIEGIDEKEDTQNSAIINEQLHSRSYYSKIKGNGDDTWTILVYVNARSVEDYGAASYLISQLAQVEYSDKVTVLLQTFGTETWKADFMKNLSDRILFSKNGVQTVSYDGEGSPGSREMLHDFASDFFEEFPSDRRAVIFWGEQELPSDDIAEALKGFELDFIAFDTQKYDLFEDAYNLKETADYLIATSSDYSTSWDFSHILYMLSKNSSILCTDISRIINESALLDPIYSRMSTTPSIFCVDLTEMDYVHACLEQMFTDAATSIKDGHYSGISLARAMASRNDSSVSGPSFAGSLNSKYSSITKKALEDCIIYSSTTGISLNLYLPVNASADKDLNVRLRDFSEKSRGEYEFLTCYMTASVSSMAKKSDSWFRNDIYELYHENNDSFIFDKSKLVFTSDGEDLLLDLSEEEGKIHSIRIHAYADTGNYFIQLGDMPAILQNTEGKTIISESIEEWLTINSQTVSTYGYRGFDDEEYYLIPCKINDKMSQLLANSEEVLTSVTTMGVFTRTDNLNTGDVIEFFYPVVSYNGVNVDDMSYGYKIAMANELQLTYEKVSIGDIIVQVVVTDIAGNQYKSELINLRSALIASEPETSEVKG